MQCPSAIWPSDGQSYGITRGMVLPFRVGTTSFIYPGGWLANVERLADRCSDIEILYFEGEGPQAFPSMTEREGLAAWKVQKQLTYSLHTPLAASLASANELARRQAVALVTAAMEASQPFRPENYILHVYLGDKEGDASRPTDVAAWRNRAALSLERILLGGASPERLCIELLDYDFALIEPVIRDLGLSVALDIGHLFRDGLDEVELLRRHLGRTRVIQWHGTDATGRDHLSLRHLPFARCVDIWKTVLEHRFEGVLTLEVFREEDFETSMGVVERLKDMAL